MPPRRRKLEKVLRRGFVLPEHRRDDHAPEDARPRTSQSLLGSGSTSQNAQGARAFQHCLF
eukprot:12932535-Alexandrium_andersonii.AAC.1